MNIPTANVVVAFSASAIQSLFIAGGQTKSLISTLEEAGDVLLFNKEANPNFISFEYTFGLGGGQHKAELKILDPDNEFESRYFTKGFEENLAGFKPKNEGEILPIGTGSRQEGMAQKTEFMRRWLDSYGSKHIYIAYGSGFNTDTWAGPYKMYLMGATIDGSKGKVVTLQLTPTPEGLLAGDRRTATQEILNMSLNGLYSKTTGLSDQLNINLTAEDRAGSTRTFDKAYDFGLYEKKEAPNGFGIDKVKKTFREESVTHVTLQEEFFKSETVKSELAGINFHDMIVDCLKSYISKATGKKNVIVLLPNLNLLLLDYIEQEATKVLATSTPSSASPRPSFGSFAFMYILASEPLDPEIQKRFIWYKVIKQIIENLGFELVADKVATDEIKTKPVQNFPISRKVLLGPFKSAEDTFRKFLEENNFRVALTTRSTNLIPNHEATIKRVMDKLIAAMMGRYPMKPIIFTENNKKWLQFWGSNRSRSYHRTFSGRISGNRQGHRFGANDEAIIFGDMGIIQNYLYAQKDIIKQPEGGFQEVQEVKDNKEALSTLRSLITEKEAQILSLSPNNPDAYELNQELVELKDQKKDARFEGLNAAIAFAGANLLAPVDRSILNEAYQRKARETILNTFRTIEDNNFGNLYQVPDEFAIGKSELKKEDQLKNLTKLQKMSMDNDFPIFKYNTSNPNVIQLKADVSNGYYVALRSGYAKAIGRQAAGVVAGALKSGHATLPILTLKDAIQYLLANEFSTDLAEGKKRALVQELEKRVSASLIDDFIYYENQANSSGPWAPSTLSPSTAPPTIPQIYDAKTIAERIGLITLQQQLEGNSPVIMVDQENPGSATDIMTSLLVNSTRRSFNITLKTTPMFHLSDVGNTVLNHCLLFAQDPPIARTNGKAKTNFFNTFLSGMYQIMGFKHKIAANGEASSEFSLIGGPVSTAGN